MILKRITLTSLAIAAMLLSGTTNVFAAEKETPIFLFGLSRSLNDSTVYMTEIQLISTAEIDTKTKFLQDREKYSEQLTEYLEKIGVNYPTTVTEYSTSRNKAEKKFLKLRNKFMREGGFELKIVTTDSFQYNPLEK